MLSSNASETLFLFLFVLPVILYFLLSDLSVPLGLPRVRIFVGSVTECNSGFRTVRIPPVPSRLTEIAGSASAAGDDVVSDGTGCTSTTVLW